MVRFIEPVMNTGRINPTPTLKSRVYTKRFFSFNSLTINLFGKSVNFVFCIFNWQIGESVNWKINKSIIHEILNIFREIEIIVFR